MNQILDDSITKRTSKPALPSEQVKPRPLISPMIEHHELCDNVVRVLDE